MFMKLPTELLEHLLQYLQKADKVSIACCNSSHRQLLEPFLWKQVKIELKNLLQPAILQHVHLARELTLVGDSGYNGGFSYDGPQVESQCINSFLDALDVEKVTSLKMSQFRFSAEDAGQTVFQKMLGLPSLQRLDLFMTNESDINGMWKSSDFPKTLQHLSFTNSEVSPEFFETILERNPCLTSLEIDGFDTFGIDLFENISEMRDLTKLLVRLFQSDDFSMDISPLGSLEKLTHLEVHTLSIEPVELLEFWNGLSGLRKLVLTVLDMSDEGFAGICALLNLEELVVLKCPEISSSTFVAGVCSLEKIRSLKFDEELLEDMLDDGSKESLFEAVGKLNTLSSLQEVTFVSDDDDFSSRVVGFFCGSVKKWTVDVDPEENYVLYRL